MGSWVLTKFNTFDPCFFKKLIELPIPQDIEYFKRVDSFATPGRPIIIGILFPSELILLHQFNIVWASKQNWLTIKKLASDVSANLFFKIRAFFMSFSFMSGLPSGWPAIPISDIPYLSKTPVSSKLIESWKGPSCSLPAPPIINIFFYICFTCNSW